MQSQNKFFEDLSKALNGAAGSFAGMAREAQDAARERAREFIGGTDFVSREEFEVVKDRLARIEATLAGTAAPSAPKKKPKA
ncbi:MAG: accessory factor UbiK family protein [Sphingopyxis sp.]